MERKVDVAIIGAGTAGLSALKEVRAKTDDFVVINGGPHGTTCARVGCMPSKVLIQVANDFHRRRSLDREGIRGGDSLSVELPAVMSHVRSLRDRFVGGVLKTVRGMGDKSVDGFARFIEPTVLEVDTGSGSLRVRADSVIIATGSRPIVPAPWVELGDRVMTSDTIFEQETLPGSLAVIGLGAIGLELGQAMNRLGVEVTGFDMLETVGGLSDPAVIEYVVEHFGKELPLKLGEAANLEASGDGVAVHNGAARVEVDRVLASLGRRPNIDRLGLKEIGVPLDERGMPEYNRETLQVGELPIFIAGDVNAERPILHEAADDGRIAGYNAVRADKTAFKRRAALRIAFSEPNLAVVGCSFAELSDREIAVGEARFDGQGRALVMGANVGILRVYGDAKTAKILGAEMLAPSGEHLAHLLSWAIQQGMTAFDALAMPFYHPVVEECLRTTLRKLAARVDASRAGFELAR